MDSGILASDYEIDSANYCLRHYFKKLFKIIVIFIVTTSAVIINGLIAKVFQFLGQYQKKHTKIEEQAS